MKIANDKLTKEQAKLLVELFKNEDVIRKPYQESLGLSNDFLFGFEIEVAGIYEDELKSRFASEKLSKCGYIAKGDWSISEEIDEYGNIASANYGGEIVTPILTDSASTWNELKEVCDFLELNASISDRCSLHVNVGANILGNDYKAWYNLLKIFAACEPEIYRVLAGKNAIRDCAILGTMGYDFAMPVAEKIRKGFNVLSRDNEDISLLLELCEFTGFRRTDGTIIHSPSAMKNKSLSFAKIYDFSNGKPKLKIEKLATTEEGNRIEIRMGNGTLEPAAIQEKLYIVSKIIDTAKHLTLEQDAILDDLLSLELPKSYNSYSAITRANKVADVLFDNSRDKINFLLRYLKEKEKKKIIDIANFDEVPI